MSLETLGLGEGEAGYSLAATFRQFVGSGQERKFAPLYFFPCRLHLSDGSEHIIVTFPCGLGNLDGGHGGFGDDGGCVHDAYASVRVM